MPTCNSNKNGANGRKFGASTDAIDVVRDVDLTGKTIFVTGTTNGIGTETARVLALKGAHVVMANRNVKQSEEVRKNIYAEYPGHRSKNNIDIIQMDLASLASVRSAAKEFISRGWPLDVLILNAGVMGPPAKTTNDGFESAFGINHLGHFYLVQLLLEKLRENTYSRIVVLSSDLHSHTGIKPSESTNDKLKKLIPDPAGSTMFLTLYNYSKMCNCLMAMKLHRTELKNGIHTYYLHPGVIGTNLTAGFGPLGTMVRFVAKAWNKTIPQGAATTVYCAASPDVAHDSGKYYDSCWDDEKKLQKNLVHDVALQDALWERSLQLIKKFEN